jgi:hypothetical protein
MFHYIFSLSEWQHLIDWCIYKHMCLVSDPDIYHSLSYVELPPCQFINFWDILDIFPSPSFNHSFKIQKLFKSYECILIFHLLSFISYLDRHMDWYNHYHRKPLYIVNLTDESPRGISDIEGHCNEGLHRKEAVSTMSGWDTNCHRILRENLGTARSQVPQIGTRFIFLSGVEDHGMWRRRVAIIHAQW